MPGGSAVIVMGVSASGKTTVGHLLAERLGWVFADADSFHSKTSIDKMRAGIALGDADRRPWLEAINAWIDQIIRSRQQGVVTCSALKQSYREILTANRSEIKIVYLKGSAALIRERLEHRAGHFMPATLLDSQFDALEEPKESKNIIVVSIEPPPEGIVQNILDELAQLSSEGGAT